MVTILLILGAFVLLVVGFPLWLVFLSLALFGLHFLAQVPLESAAVHMFESLNILSLLAVPGFIFAGEVMVVGSMAQRLIDWVASFMGRLPGGLPVTSVAASEVFGAVTGSSTATVAAIGKVLYPGLRDNGYSERFSLGLLTSMGAIATIIPPSITMILFAVIAGASVGKLFLAGVLPGLFIGLLLSIYSVWYAARHHVIEKRGVDEKGAIWKATKRALWTLGAPLIVFGGIYGGFFSPTEASIVISIYAILVTMIVFRSMSWGQLWQAAQDTAILSAKIFVIVASASTFSLFLVYMNVTNGVVDFINGAHLTVVTVLIMVNIALLIAGMFMDPNSALVVLVPLFWPVAQALGVDMIHFGIIMTVNLAIGMFTPPFGLNLFVSTSVFEVPATRVIRAVIPFVGIYLVALAVITYVPGLSLWLPGLWHNA